MSIELLCRKLGMTRVFDETGNAIPVTVLEAGPNTVYQKKTEDRDGYTALQLGFGSRRDVTTTKAALGHARKAAGDGASAPRILKESRISSDDAEAHEVGAEITADVFEPGERVDVVGKSKGRGTAGVVKRHNFAIKKMTHGTHEFWRHGGSIGAGAFPGRVIKGLGMPGRHGNERVTTRNLVVVRVEPERNLLFVRGAVPGHRNGIVRVRKAVASH